jgi:2-keto-4-pentenoate hydratase
LVIKLDVLALVQQNFLVCRGPIRGTLFESEVHESGVKLNANQFCNLAIEAEMAIKVGENGTIQSIFPVIELHNFVFRAPQKSLSELIANNGLNKGIILSKNNWQTSAKVCSETSVLIVRNKWVRNRFWRHVANEKWASIFAKLA